MRKEQARTLIQHLLDDPEGKRWHPQALDLLTEIEIDSLWSDVLRIAPYYLDKMETLSSFTSPGYIDLSSDLAERLFRIKKITRDGKEYTEADERLVLIEDNDAKVYTSYTYVRMGSALYLFPFDTSTEVEIHYSYRPTKYTDLDDEAQVVWPDGHDMAYIYRVVGMAFGKGMAEDGTDFKQEAKDAKFRMLAEIEKYATGPMAILTTESPQTFGGT